MSFLVFAPTGELLSDVEVVAVNADGLVKIGQTDRGVLSVEPEALRNLHPYVVLFCHEHFPCGALVVRERFFGFREHDVRLAPFIVR